MVTSSTILAWKIPWTEKPGGLHGYSPQGHMSTVHMTEHACTIADSLCCRPETNTAL